MKKLIAYLSLVCTVNGELMTPSPTIEKYSGLFMPISEQNSNLFFLLLPGEARLGDDQKIKLDDEEFALAIKETENHRIYHVRTRGGMLTHNCLDANKGLIYLMDLANLKQLHVAQTDVTWAAANEFRGKMQAIAGNEDLEITTGYYKPSLLSYNLIKRLRATYQTNTYNGKLNPNFKVEISGEEVKGNTTYDDKDDAKKSETGPILEQ